MHADLPWLAISQPCIRLTPCSACHVGFCVEWADIAGVLQLRVQVLTASACLLNVTSKNRNGCQSEHLMILCLAHLFFCAGTIMASSSFGPCISRLTLHRDTSVIARDCKLLREDWLRLARTRASGKIFPQAAQATPTPISYLGHRGKNC